MAAVANQVHSTAQQICARIVWNPIDAATQPPTGTRERVLNLSDPRTDHRNLGFESHSIYSARLLASPTRPVLTGSKVPGDSWTSSSLVRGQSTRRETQTSYAVAGLQASKTSPVL